MPSRTKPKRPQPAPVTDTERARVRQLHAAGKTRNQIAAELGRSASTISLIAKAAGLTFSGGARVAAATQARRLDLAQARRDITERLTRRVLTNLDRLEAGTYEYKHVTGEGMVVTVRTEHPPAQDERHHAQAIASYMTTAQRLTDIDGNGQPAEQVRSMLGDLAAGLAAAARRTEETDHGE